MIKVGKNKVDMYRGFWTPNTYYDADDMVFEDGQLWIANANFSSTGTFDEVNWTPLCCERKCVTPEDGWDICSHSQFMNVSGLAINSFNPLQSPEYIFGSKSLPSSGNYYFEVLVTGTDVYTYGTGISWSNLDIAGDLNSDADTLILYGGGGGSVGGVSLGALGYTVSNNNSFAIVVKNKNVYFGRVSPTGIPVFHYGQDPWNDVNPAYIIPSSNDIRFIGYVSKPTITLSLRANATNIATLTPFPLTTPWDDM